MPHPMLHRLAILTLVIAPLVGLVVAIVLLWNQYVFWTDIALLIGLYVPTALGVTIGYHRMLTHDGFNAPSWIRALFLILGAMAFEGSPSTWTATHIKHHAHSDEDDDPHSPLHGFWHAHFGWLFRRENFADVRQYAPKLLDDPVVVFVDKLMPVWFLLSLIIPFALGGWTGFIWGGLVRIFFTTHVTWSVNSVCHTFGKRAFETTDASRNEWVVGLLALGEGWHNNHHAFPRNAFHGMRWWQFDVSGLLIRTLERFTLVWDVQRVSREVELAQRERALQAHAAIEQLRRELGQTIAQAQAQLQSTFWNAVSPTASTLWRMRQDMETRLSDMQRSFERATHCKKQRLQMWLAETRQILADIQTMCTRETGLVSVATASDDGRQPPAA